MFQCVNILVVDMKLSESDNLTKVLDFVGEPCTLLNIESDAGFSQPSKNCVNVFDVLLWRGLEDDDVV